MLREMLSEVFSDYDSLSGRAVELSTGADFLQFTMGRVEDAYKTFDAMYSVVENCLVEGDDLSYIEIVQAKPELLSPIINIAKRHHYRGVTLDFFMECWKVIVHAIEEEAYSLEGYTDEAVRDLHSVIRKTYDACETLFLKEWMNTKVDDLQYELMKTNREITLAKNKYQNVFDGASDLIVITDKNGDIIEFNAAAKEYFEKYLNQENLCVCDLFGTDCDSLFATFGDLSDNDEKYITLSGNDHFLMKVRSLDKVTYNYSGYIVILNDVTSVVVRNQMLKSEISKKTSELRKSKTFFQSIFSSANAGIFIFDSDFKIYTQNNTAENIVGMDAQHLNSLGADNYLIDDGGLGITEVMRNLGSSSVWSGELKLNTCGNTIDILATINAMDVEGKNFYSLIFIDISKIKDLERQLINEKRMVEEKNITLRNVIQSMVEENDENIKKLCEYAESRIEPMLSEIVRESRSEARNELKSDILLNIKFFKDEFRGNNQRDELVSLTHSESIVCNYIKSGYSSKEIAEKLNVSIDTVHTHRKNIRKKFGITDKCINLYSYVKSNY